MSEKNQKKMRKFNRELDLLRPIMAQASKELGSDKSHFLSWMLMANAMRKEHPELPLEQFLPSRLQSTMQGLMGTEQP